MLHPLHDETVFARLIIGSENTQKRTGVLVLHATKYHNSPQSLSGDDGDDIISCGADGYMTINSNLRMPDLVRSETLHCHYGVPPSAFGDIAKNSSVDEPVRVQYHVFDEYLAR